MIDRSHKSTRIDYNYFICSQQIFWNVTKNFSSSLISHIAAHTFVHKVRNARC